jgi:hypothetical protein
MGNFHRINGERDLEWENLPGSENRFDGDKL